MSTGDERTYKIVLAGQYGVGKTSLRRRFMGTARFRRNYIPTVGSDFSFKQIRHKSQDFKLLIWDLAGEARFRQYRSLYFQGAHGAIFTFDLTDVSTFEILNEWIVDLENYTNDNGVPFILVGNKSDLVLSEEEQKVKDLDVENYIEEVNERFGNQFPISFMKTSALNGHNVEKVFTNLIEIIQDFINNNQTVKNF